MESIYKSYTPEQYDELSSNFLISSWSYSKVTSFARNEKAFEMQHIFGLYSRNSASSVAGNAYHTALQYYFTQKKEGKTLDLVELEGAAFAYIDEVPGNRWKIQKTTPTIEACQKKATEIVTKLLKNFVSEKETYEDDIDEILEVEVRGDEFVTINGVDIPLTLHFVIDLVARTKSSRIAVIDHKSKAAFTDEQEIVLTSGVQAMTYVKGYESRTGQAVDEVWFVENKYSQNKDGSPQLNAFKLNLDENSRRLHEALLYEPLRRMIEAVSNPDYVYLINQSDNFVDKAELYDFWMRTMICEVGEFNVEETKKGLVEKRLKKIRDSSIASVSPAIIKKFKESAATFIQYDLSDKDMAQAEKIEHTLRTFNVLAKCAHQFEGYSSNTFLLEVSAGVKMASIHNYKLDIANALDVANVRIAKQLTVYEGRSYLQLDFSKKREKNLLYNVDDLVGWKIPIGKDNFGNVIVWDLENHATPHVLVCGQTGSGKSASVYSTICYAQEAGIRDIIVLDPKHEFKKLAKPGIEVINEIGEIEMALEKLVDEMNELVRTGQKRRKLIVFDEFADALAQSKGNALEHNLRVLAQKGRSLGFRIMAVTQRASSKIITGDTKVNFPVQICYRVNKEIDSRVVLDEAGAESLAGKGDGLIRSAEYNDTVRFQAYYKPGLAETIEEIETVE